MANKNINYIGSFPNSVIKFIEYLKSNRNILRVILFGSRVHADFNEKSDFDIAIEFKFPNSTEFLKIKDFVHYQFNSLYYISLVDYNNSPEKLKQIIKDTGVTIYEY